MLTATQRTLASQKTVHRRDGLLLHIGDDVGVGIQRQPDAAMPQEFTDDFGVDALLQEQRRSRMPQVVKADMRQACFVEEWPEGPAQEIARFHGLADLVCKDEVVIFPDLPQTEPLCGLPTAMVA